MTAALEAEAQHRAAIIREARRWIGTPWRHLGRSAHGLDCVGLVVMVCRALDLSSYDITGYGRDPRAADFVGHFTAGGGTRIPIAAALPGDLLLFREERYPCHAGILSDRDGIATVIHAHATRRKVLEEVLIREWLDKRVAAIRVPMAVPA